MASFKLSSVKVTTNVDMNGMKSVVVYPEAGEETASMTVIGKL
jgi:hypothetical protein